MAGLFMPKFITASHIAKGDNNLLLYVPNRLLSGACGREVCLLPDFVVFTGKE